jgi:integrase
LKVERLGIVKQKKVLPSLEKFRELLKRLDAMPARSRAALVVRFLAFGGPRITAAGGVKPVDVDLKRGEITLPPIKYQDRPLTVPMFQDMIQVVKQLLRDHPGGDLPLLPIKSPRRALRSACRELGMEILTPHDLRHLFTTHCLESGLSVAEVAALRGDKDGGAMLLKQYAHLRNEHLHRVARKIRW